MGKRIGIGTFGDVYAGTLANGKGVAIKVLQMGATEFEHEEFLAEIDLLRELPPHPHIIAFVGQCLDSDTPLLLLDLMELGNLRDYLRKSRASSAKTPRL